jgi:hypothetical protein
LEIADRSRKRSYSHRATENFHQQICSGVVAILDCCGTESVHRHAIFNMLFGNRGICHQIALLVFDALLHQPIDLSTSFQDGGCENYLESAAHGKILVTTIIELLAISCVQCKYTQTTR